MPRNRAAAFIHSLPVHLLGVLESLLGVLKSLPGALMPGLVIVLFVRVRGGEMSVGGIFVQLGGPLMIPVMRPVVITLRHL